MAKKHHSRRKMTFIRAFKWAIGVGPVLGVGISQVAASPNAQGLQNAVGTATSAYTGYNPATGQWNWSALLLGYVPLGGAWAFGKIASRVLR